MKTWIACMVAMAMGFSAMSVATAKRPAPQPTPPVTVDGIEYRAPGERMGCLEAWDVKSGKMLWWRQVYVIVFDSALEKDVQDVFIREMKPGKGALMIVNERGGEYTLDLKTLEIQAVKGSIVLRR